MRLLFSCSDAPSQEQAFFARATQLEPWKARQGNSHDDFLADFIERTDSLTFVVLFWLIQAGGGDKDV